MVVLNCFYKPWKKKFFCGTILEKKVEKFQSKKLILHIDDQALREVHCFVSNLSNNCIILGRQTGPLRFWVFGTEEGVKRFAASKETFADGCYKVLFDEYQLYTVLGK